MASACNRAIVNGQPIRLAAKAARRRLHLAARAAFRVNQYVTQQELSDAQYRPARPAPDAAARDIRAGLAGARCDTAPLAVMESAAATGYTEDAAAAVPEREFTAGE